MVSARGEKKENKKSSKPAAQSPQVSSRGEPPSTDATRALSPRRLTKKPSLNNVDLSDKGPIEGTLNEEEEVSSIGPLNAMSPVPSDATVQPMDDDGVLRPPPLHFVPFAVKLDTDVSDPKLFSENVRYNKNMVVTSVRQPLIQYFIAGDQISSVNGTAVWNRRHFDREYVKAKQTEHPDNLITITVIRVWNYSCPTKTMIEKTGVIFDDRYQYFVVRLWHYYRAHGISLTSVKKLIYVSELRAKSDSSFGLMTGDQLLLVGEIVLTSKNNKSFKKKQCEYKDFIRMQHAAKQKYVDVFACRPILARSSPNPSLEAELFDLNPERCKTALEKEKSNSYNPPLVPHVIGGTTGGTSTGTTPSAGTPGAESKMEKKESDEPLNPLLEADALEIALRELCHLQISVKTDASLPYHEKGRSLLRPTPTAATTTTTGADKSVYAPTSTYGATPSTMGTPTAGTPRKLKRWKKAQQPARQNTITFKPENETTKISSDIPEEAELKKCDPRSGIVAYIKNAFNN